MTTEERKVMGADTIYRITVRGKVVTAAADL